MLVIVVVAATISFGIASFREGMVMVIIVVVNALIGFVHKYKVRRIPESLRQLIRPPPRVLVDGELPEIPQNELEPGDVVRVEAEDRIPVDVRIIESFDLRTSSP